MPTKFDESVNLDTARVLWRTPRGVQRFVGRRRIEFVPGSWHPVSSELLLPQFGLIAEERSPATEDALGGIVDDGLSLAASHSG